MRDEFVAIDFETANPARSSACAVGYALVVDGEIVEAGRRLIRPEPFEFDSYHTFIHNMTAADVKHAPGFAEVWQGLGPVLGERPLVAHNAGFDMSVLRSALDVSALSYPVTDYYCTRITAKAIWPGLVNYRLATVAAHLGIGFDHHDPQEDAVACAKVALAACQAQGVGSLAALWAAMSRRPGRLLADGYQASDGRMAARGGSGHTNLSKLEAEGDVDPAHPFFGQRVVFTGTLQSMTRTAAAQLVVNAGGSCANAMSAQVNYLVVGDQDYSRFVDGKKSGKMRKAEELVGQGVVIEIIPEQEFLELL